MSNVKIRIVVAIALFFGGILYSKHWDDVALPIGYTLACVGLVMLVAEYIFAWRRTVLANQRLQLTGDARDG